MADIDQTVALGVKAPQQQGLSDIVAPIASLAQLSYLGANAQRLGVETQGLALNNQFQQGKLGALQNYNSRVQAGERPESAIVTSGLSTYDPTGANAALGNVKTGMQIGAVRNYDPSNPNSLASGGPELVGQGASALSAEASTAGTNLDNSTKRATLYGQLGNVMASDPSPGGRARAVQIARNEGIPDAQIAQFANLPDDQYVAAGQHFQQASMTPEKYMDASGQATYNQGRAKAATDIRTVGPSDSLYMGVGAQGAFTGGVSAGGAMGASAAGQPVPNGTATGYTAPGGVPASRTAQPASGGFSPQGLSRTAQIESGGNPNAVNGNAAGMFQFEPGTWKQFGQGSPFDPGAATAAAQRLSAANAPVLAQALGRAPTDAELYIAHQQGAGGAAKLLAYPNARAGSLVGDAAIRSNGGDPNAPASAFTSKWTAKFNGATPNANSPTIAGALTPTPTGFLPRGGSQPPVSASPTVPISLADQPSPARPQLAAPQAAPAAGPDQTVAARVGTNAPAPAAAPTPAFTAAAPNPPQPAAPSTSPYGTIPAMSPQPVVRGLTPSTLAEQQGIGRAYGELPQKLDDAATAAKAQNTSLDQLQNSADGWQQGKWADVREDANESLQAVAKQFGINTPDLDKSVANYQDFVKQAGVISRAASAATSSNVGVQEMKLINKSLPSPETSSGGLKIIASQLKGLNDFAIAKQQAAGAWRSQYGSLGPSSTTKGADFQTAWNGSASPAAFVAHRMQAENPQGFADLVRTMRAQPGGVQALQNLKQQMTWANGNGLFDAAPPLTVSPSGG